MKKISTKRKLFILKITGILLCVLTIFGITTIFTAIGCAELWADIPQNGITSFSQWSTLILYRLLIYLLLAIILSFFPFDKRYKWMTRFIVFLSWTFFVYLFSNVIIAFFEIDTLLDIIIFENLDTVIMLAGYVLTAISKKKIEFDSSGAIIGELKK